MHIVKEFTQKINTESPFWLRKFTLGNNGVEPTYEIMIEPLP